MTEEEEPQNNTAEVNPDALEALFVEEVSIEEEVVAFPHKDEDEDVDEIDIAFQANDEGYW